MLSFKETVRIGGIQPQLIIGLMLAEQVFAALSSDCIITSCNDSVHMPKSLHYAGKALDFRTKHLMMPDKVFAALKSQLEPLGFQVIWEDKGGNNQHFHIEHDPKVPPGISISPPAGLPVPPVLAVP